MHHPGSGLEIQGDKDSGAKSGGMEIAVDSLGGDLAQIIHEGIVTNLEVMTNDQSRPKEDTYCRGLSESLHPPLVIPRPAGLGFGHSRRIRESFFAKNAG